MKRTLLAAMMILSLPLLASGAPVEVSDFVVTTSDGHSIRLSNLKGKWVLVNYWATWCGACVAEMPALSKLAGKEPKLIVLGLTDERISTQKLRTFLAAHPASYPIAIVTKDSLPKELPASAFGFQMRPISYLVGPDGKLVERFLGDLDIEKIERLIVEHQP